MKIKSILFLLTVILLLSGCIQTKGFSVKVEPMAGVTEKGSVNGIPFYKKIPVFVQTSIYLDPFYEIRLFINYESSAGTVMKTIALLASVRSIREKDLDGCNKFFDTARNLSTSEEIVKTFEKIVENTYLIRGYNDKDFDDYLKDTEAMRPILHSNNIDSKMVIDWKNLYYINYKVPIAGKSSLTVELNNEGTLSKAVGETENKALETIVGAVSSFLPIKEFFTSKIPKALTTESVTPPAFSLEIEKKVCKYTLQKIYREEQADYPAIGLDDSSASRMLEILDSSTIKKDEKISVVKNSIEIAGQIKLPEEKKDAKK